MREQIASLFDQTVASVSKHYQRSEPSSMLIVEEVLVSILEEALLDSSRLTFIEFSKRYLNKAIFFEYKDFTSSEIREIIAETPFTERDRKMAGLRYLDCASEEEIADRLQIDKKTVHSNLPKISMSLKLTASKIFAKKR